MIDGKDSGKVTPAVITGLDPKVDVEITLDLRGRILHRSKVKPTGERPYRVILEPAKRLVRLLSTPAGAAVFINGRELGKTPYDHSSPRLKPGRGYWLWFKHPGYRQKDIKFYYDKLPWKRQGLHEMATISAELEPRRRRKKKKDSPDEPGLSPR